jgi:hypothetical protein
MGVRRTYVAFLGLSDERLLEFRQGSGILLHGLLEVSGLALALLDEVIDLRCNTDR